ncbi:hypothetical protein H9Q10_11310 [Eikenella sp. S3360]|uniref:Uncharacterized protein n=1 Tax=Eikenella glucosivorans TaxID=2766967 RepID=A0ABS0NDB2_9NEIS|nr:hypothetical protein [Eikenella glucosivorans]MBH5330251.1 hypothetical protein [Eikenella glucosivorans]
MAEARTDEATRRKRRRTLIGWLAVTAALVLGFALLPRLYSPDPADISRRVVEACVKNMPAVPQWQADLAKYGLAGQGERVLEPYCRCLWEEPIGRLSEDDLRSLPRLSPQEQLDKLGGSAAFEQRQAQCLAAQAKH